VKDKVLILGATGVLGFELAIQASKFSNIDLTISTRSMAEFSVHASNISAKVIEFTVEDFMNRPHSYDFDEFDVIINAIGAIKQKSFKENDMLQINGYFPIKLAETVNSNTQIFHFTTDCVYLGDDSSVKDEYTAHDANDIYGKSKSIGEVHKSNVINLRSSFVGMEINNSYSLLGWFLNLEKNSIIPGYTNQFWNGITANSYSKIILNLIECFKRGDIQGRAVMIPQSQVIHIVPKNYVSKYELLELFKENTNRNDIVIQPTVSEKAINRVISTKFDSFNIELWKGIGYLQVPTIQELVQDMMDEYKARKLD